MTTNTLSQEISKRAGWSIFMGFLTAAVGVVMILYPTATAAFSTVFLGWALLVAAVAQVVFAFSSETAGNFFLKLLLGIVYGIAGIALAAFPLAGVMTLTGVLGTMLIMEAILEAVIAFSVMPSMGRTGFLVSSIASLILGVLILAKWPSSSAWAIGTLLGAAVLTNGIMRIMISATVRGGLREAERLFKAA